MTRYPDWPERLATFIERRLDVSFSWGTNDCVTHAADEVWCITGTDPLGAWRGAWTDESSATAFLERLGGLHAAVTSVLGQPLEMPVLAQRGDVVLVRLSSGTELLAVCVGSRWLAPAEGVGSARGPMSMAVAAWAVGRAA